MNTIYSSECLFQVSDLRLLVNPLVCDCHCRRCSLFIRTKAGNIHVEAIKLRIHQSITLDIWIQIWNIKSIQREFHIVSESKFNVVHTAVKCLAQIRRVADWPAQTPDEHLCVPGDWRRVDSRMGTCFLVLKAVFWHFWPKQRPARVSVWAWAAHICSELPQMVGRYGNTSFKAEGGSSDDKEATAYKWIFVCLSFYSVVPTATRQLEPPNDKLRSDWRIWFPREAQRHLCSAQTLSSTSSIWARPTRC